MSDELNRRRTIRCGLISAASFAKRESGLHNADVRINGAKREVLRFGFRRGQRVEKSRFADVW